MKNKELSIIMPFLNEGNEVENTIKSIYETSNEELDVILVNDASDDGYDYKILLNKYNVIYIENENRRGVSVCRNIGVEHCKTPFFLFLDAHMRFNSSNWVKAIVDFLNKNDKVLICCQTKELRMDENGIIYENKDRPISYGAFVDLYNRLNLFEPIWIFESKDNSDCVDIPCVLGAGYAMSKVYWNLLNGLVGLKQYGNDEAYLSIKVWLQGGRCVLFKNVEISHLYRNSPPYCIDLKYRIYNRLFLAEVLLPHNEKKRIYSLLKYTCKSELFSSVLLLIHQKSKEITKIRHYHTKIFQKEFSSFEIFNNEYLKNANNNFNEQNMINQIAYKIITDFHTTTNIGLLSGQMGMVIFLFHYAKYINNKNFHELAYELLKVVFDKIDATISIDFHSGLCGIGWGLEYLVQKQIINIDTNDILTDVDKKVNEIRVEQMNDFEQNHGLGGVVHYIVARIKSKNNNKTNIDASVFYKKALSLLKPENFSLDSFDVFLKLIRTQDKVNFGDLDDSSLSIYDLLYLNNEVDCLNSNKLGLDGLAGLGLNMIWNNTYAFTLMPSIYNEINTQNAIKV